MAFEGGDDSIQTEGKALCRRGLQHGRQTRLPQSTASPSIGTISCRYPAGLASALPGPCPVSITISTFSEKMFDWASLKVILSDFEAG